MCCRAAKWSQTDCFSGQTHLPKLQVLLNISVSIPKILFRESLKLNQKTASEKKHCT